MKKPAFAGLSRAGLVRIVSPPGPGASNKRKRASWTSRKAGPAELPPALAVVIGVGSRSKNGSRHRLQPITIRRMQSWRTAGRILGAVLAVQVLYAQPAPTVIIRASRLIDGRGGAPLEPAMVRISGDRIDEVVPAIDIPPAATVIDLGAATLLPGL